eukprot:GILJ01003422.1.p1 GENE.GILJ01003422.1~~GILJ01003422.1.p1  ORF type:complete len:292 (+),score=39.89 GILJ01003422.1:50-925(+)
MLQLSSLVSASIDLAEKAGAIIRGVMMSGDLKLHMKGVDDPQTIADISAQRLIVGSLRKQWPTLKLIGEEDLEGDLTEYGVETCLDLLTNAVSSASDQQVPLDQIVVWIDPLDGTKEFTLGRYDAVTTLIGIAVNGVATAGVVHQPFWNEKGRSIWGMVGVGAFGFDRVEPPAGRNVVITTASHPTPRLERALSLVGPDQVLRVGGAGNKAVAVLEGTADVYLYPSPGTKKWDICAGEAVVRALGGSVTDVYGKAFYYGADTIKPNDNGVLLSLRGDHDRYVQLLAGIDSV